MLPLRKRMELREKSLHALRKDPDPSIPQQHHRSSWSRIHEHPLDTYAWCERSARYLWAPKQAQQDALPRLCTTGLPMPPWQFPATTTESDLLPLLCPARQVYVPESQSGDG